MLRPRIIASLLVHEGGLVKTVGFKSPKYVGDPINAVRIFNEKECDELAVFDIDASVNRREPDFGLIENLAVECRMPLAYGGGVASAAHARRIISLGVEKVCLSSSAVNHPELVSEISGEVGRQSVVVVLDYRKRRFSSEREVYLLNGTVPTGKTLLATALQMQERGAGEIVFNSIDRDGAMKGYDLDLAHELRRHLHIPFTMLGGAGSLTHVAELVATCDGIVGAAAGSMFVFKGQYRAVLINYPNQEQRDGIATSVVRGS